MMGFVFDCKGCHELMTVSSLKFLVLGKHRLDNLAFGMIPDISLKKSIHIEQLLYMYIILCCYLNIIVFPTT